MKTTRKEIIRMTNKRRIEESQMCNYTCQIAEYENYTNYFEVVCYIKGGNMHQIGFARTKRQFVELVYNHINTKNVKS